MTDACLIGRIETHRAHITVVGQGYVGLPLAAEFARAGFSVAGLDTDPDRVAALSIGRSHSPDVESDDLMALLRSGRYEATSDFSVFQRSDVVIICVPTPLRKSKDPDISFVMLAAEQVAARFRPGQLVILESTTYPGTTEELLLPLFEARPARVGVDFFLAFSPERIDPGNAAFKVRDIPKIVGGVTPDCTRLAALLYRQIVPSVIEVSSARVAELAKLYENVFRNVNIALANEFALMCRRLDENTLEVIDAAATKPFGFMPFYPGPGLGGHCIPIDPHYLSWKLKTLNYTARFIELASEINGNMPTYVVNKAVEALNDQRKSVRGANILVLGVAYKRDVGDVRESPALDVIKLLLDRGAEVRYNDPFAPEITLDGGRKYHSVRLDREELRAADLVIIVTNHTGYDYDFIVRHSRSVLDTRNATRGLATGRDRIKRL